MYNVIPNLRSFLVKDLFEIYADKFGLKYKKGTPRVSEKIHEIMCPNETAHLTYEFKDHYLINQSVKNEINKKIKNKIGEIGTKVKANFEYNSGDNKFLSLEQIKKLNKSLKN